MSTRNDLKFGAAIIGAWILYILFYGWYRRWFAINRTVLHNGDQLVEYRKTLYNKHLIKAVNQLWAKSDIPFPMTIEERMCWWRPVEEYKFFNRELTYTFDKEWNIVSNKTKNYVY
ncbi:hypothetical protein pEaSNUABM37_00088 [Erwinia phage pEa_SNUABM_37]|nr:hypothetical protein pEaSNUABM37_00088 [Erwinia phage pEa_SNUABM_37]QXO10558.1 hypothetical protein pEaSNUABM48_00088 [Erwinia phage pEa_SNUABM_48]